MQLYSRAKGDLNQFIHLILERYEMSRDDLIGIARKAKETQSKETKKNI